jgi:hypothetical protein
VVLAGAVVLVVLVLKVLMMPVVLVVVPVCGSVLLPGL